MSLMDLIGQQLGGDRLKQISQQLGTDESTTSNAVQSALPTLLGALSRNAQKPDGAQALHNALAKDHDGGLLDNVSGFLSQGGDAKGQNILRHVLGNQQSRVESGLSQTAGMDKQQTNKLLGMLAPVVLGALGKEQKSKGLDVGALAGMLGQERQMVEAKAPKEMGLVSKLLDSDGDGDLDLSDFVKHGGGALGKLFGR